MIRVSDRPQIFTAGEAADLVTREIDRFREPLRRDASHADAYTAPRLRAELVAQIDLLNLLDETIRTALGAPSRVGPDRPELRDIPEPDGPEVLSPVPPTHRRAYPAAARWIPDGTQNP